MSANSRTKFITRVALLAAISTVLYYLLEIPIPGFEHLKVDLSALPSVIGAVMIGPFAGVLIEFIKNLLHLFRSTTLGIGELASFAVGSAMLLGFALTLRSLREKLGLIKAYIVAFIVGMAASLVVGWIVNYLLTPLFFQQVLGVPLSHEALMVAVWGSTALNVLKSCVSILPVLIIIKRISPNGLNFAEEPSTKKLKKQNK